MVPYPHPPGWYMQIYATKYMHLLVIYMEIYPVHVPYTNTLYTDCASVCIFCMQRYEFYLQYMCRSQRQPKVPLYASISILPFNFYVHYMQVVM